MAIKHQTSSKSREPGQSSQSFTIKSNSLMGKSPSHDVKKSKQSSDVAINQCQPERLIKQQKDRVIINFARFKLLKKKADEAIIAHKTFMMRARWPIVRKTFRDRDWIELFECHYKPNPSGQSIVKYDSLVKLLPKRLSNESEAKHITRCERFALSRLIEHHPVALTWSWVPNKIDFDHQLRYPEMIVNKLIQSPFGTKDGLAHDLRYNAQWLFEENLVEVNFPRSYNSTDRVEIIEFLENFRNTACISFLRYVVEKSTKGGWKVLFDSHPAGEVPFSAFEFALKRCNEIVNSSNHNDIDLERSNVVTDRDWDGFLKHHYLLTHENSQILIEHERSVEPIVRNAEMLLDSIKSIWPDYELDCCQNIWIVKPGDDMCGKGIELTNSLKKIRNLIGSTETKRQKSFVIQKYIERPLLIYNTKFDIRQYFVVTNVYPLVIWMYRENYLRFSTQQFDLHNLHESIHMTNNAIQRKYKVSSSRDDRLPRQNMWDNHMFQAYLRQIGKSDMWTDRIYPGIKRAIIATILASQHRMIHRDNTFQLYGADFMICENFKPWMIEINVCPNLFLTTNITARMVPQCIEDVLKVVIDRKLDAKANTGNFDLIYNQTVSFSSSSDADHKLIVKGKLLSNIRKEFHKQLVSQSNANPSLPISTKKSITNRTYEMSTLNHLKDFTSANKCPTTPEKLEEVRLNLKNITTGSQRFAS